MVLLYKYLIINKLDPEILNNLMNNNKNIEIFEFEC